jgi:hypothetical protein
MSKRYGKPKKGRRSKAKRRERTCKYCGKLMRGEWVTKIEWADDMPVNTGERTLQYVCQNLGCPGPPTEAVRCCETCGWDKPDDRGHFCTHPETAIDCARDKTRPNWKPKEETEEETEEGMEEGMEEFKCQ